MDILSQKFILFDFKDGYFLNKGKFIEFVLVTSSADGIATGEYIFEDKADDSTSAFSFNSNSCYCLNWVFGGTNLSTFIASGTLSVIRNGNNYEMSFNGKDDEVNTVTVDFEGVGTYYDFAGIKSSQR